MTANAPADYPPTKSTSLAASRCPSRPAAERRPGRGGPAVRKFLPILVRTVISLSLIGAAIGVVLVLGQADPPRTRKATEKVYPVVEVTAVEPHPGGIDFNVDGVVVPFQEVEVPAEVAGTVVFRSENCRVGRTVTQGELLLKIDPQDYTLEVRRLREQLRQAHAEQHELEVQTAACKRQIELAQEDLAIKQREVARYERIDDPGVYSKSELDAARLTELQARDALQTERDQLELLQSQRERLASACDLVQSQLEKAQLDERRTEIHAPIGGVITSDPVEKGSYVARGGIVFVIRDTSCMEVKCSLQVHQMHWLWQGTNGTKPADSQSATYRFPETPVTVVYQMRDAEYRWEGTLHDYDGAEIDQQTRMVPCRVLVPNPRKAARSGRHQTPAAPPGLMAGMFVTVQVHARPLLPLFRIPEASVQPGNTVWMVSDVAKAAETHRGRLRKIKVAVAYGDKKTVLIYGSDSHLPAGSLVVASPVASPVDGMEVELLTADPAGQRDTSAVSAGPPAPRSPEAG